MMGKINFGGGSDHEPSNAAIGDLPGAEETLCVFMQRARLRLEELAAVHRAEEDRLIDELFNVDEHYNQSEVISTTTDLMGRNSKVPGRATSRQSSPTTAEKPRSSGGRRAPCDDVPPTRRGARRPSWHTDESATSAESPKSHSSGMALEERAFRRSDMASIKSRASVSVRVKAALDRLQQSEASQGGKMELLMGMAAWFANLAAVPEPPRTGFAAKICESRGFNAICLAVVFCNSAYLVSCADRLMDAFRAEEQLRTDGKIFELSFMVFYMLELSLKLFVHRLYYFVTKDIAWNVFDVCLVAFSVVEVVGSITASDDGHLNLGFMRMLKLFKLVKVLRAIRTIRFFSELRVLFDCVFGAMVSLFWSLLMILFIIYIYALLIVQILAQTLATPNETMTTEQEEEVVTLFSSVVGAMLTLLAIATGGRDWGDVGDLMPMADPFAEVALITFVILTTFAIWNIVTSLFVDQARRAALPDVDMIVAENTAQVARDTEALTEVFTALDVNLSGTLNAGELQLLLRERKFHEYLRVRGIRIEDPDFFHTMLMSVAGEDCEELDIAFVVAACIRMRGGASSLDLHTLIFETKLMNRRHRKYLKDCRERLSRIEAAVLCLQEDDNMSGNETPVRPTRIANQTFGGDFMSIPSPGRARVPADPRIARVFHANPSLFTAL